MSTTTTLEPLTGFRAWLSQVDGEGLADADRLVLIGALEELKAVAAAAQVRVTEAFDTSQRCTHVQAGGEAGKASRSIGSQLALVLRCSPSRGDAFRHLATVLTDQMPHTLHALTQGVIGQYHAQVAVTATSGLPVGVREHIDEVLAPDLPSLTPKQLGAACRRVAAQVDAAGVVARINRAAGSRRVTVRPAPDGLAYLSVLGPLAEVVGAYATLRRDAHTIIGGQDPTESAGGRGLGAVMADLALRRLSGRGVGEGQPVMVDLVITDRSLLGVGDPTRPTSEPAHVPGYGPVPVPAAHAWLGDPGTPARIRRLFTSVDGRDLVAMESRSRGFTGALAEMIRLRDQSCAAPWCDAPIRDIDHTHPYRNGGPTSYHNGEGLCRRCNDTKEQPGWHVHTHPNTETRGAPQSSTPNPDQTGQAEAGTTRRVTWTTPTGHTHTTSPPPLLGPGWHPPQSALAGEEAEDGPGVPSPGWRATVNPNQGEEAGAIRNVTWTTSTGRTHATSPPPLLEPGRHLPSDLADDTSRPLLGPGCHPPPHLADDRPPLSTLVDIIWTPNSGLEIHLDAA